MKDLFENYTDAPKELSKILDKWAKKSKDGRFTHNQIDKLQKEVEAIGYTFDYDFDMTPFALRPIGTPLEEIEGFEETPCKPF